MEIGLAGIKGLIAIKKLIAPPLGLLTGFFRWLFRLLFYKILVKLYYQAFRWRQSGVIKNSPFELLRKQSVYFFILFLVCIIFFANVTDKTRPGTIETKIKKTVMANLVKTEFSALSDDQLIEEVMTPGGLLTLGKERYIEDSCALEKSTLISGEDDSQPDGPIFSEQNDLVYKPVGSGELGADGTAIVRTQVIYYTVQNGDTVSTIARRFGLTINTLLWANNLSAYSLIRPGDKLTILPTSGVLYTVKKGDTLAKIAQRYGLGVDKILSCNNIGGSLSVGQRLILPGASKINESVAVRTSSGQSGVSVIKDLIKNPGVKVTGTKMAWPAGGYRITQYFSWRHPGVDIANKVGTPLYAADSGTVIIAQGGWNGGYGNTIVIDHGGGKKTRYGHLSKLFVKVGDHVDKGENIGAMGSTGRSTGPHLHFEVIINGTKYNPLNYIR